MFRITEDPSSGSLVRCLAKNYRNDSVVSVDMGIGVMATYCDLLCVCSSLYMKALPDSIVSIDMDMIESGSAFIYSELHTHNRSEYAAITPTLSVSTDTTESFL